MTFSMYVDKLVHNGGLVEWIPTHYCSNHAFQWWIRTWSPLWSWLSLHLQAMLLLYMYHCFCCCCWKKVLPRLLHKYTGWLQPCMACLCKQPINALHSCGCRLLVTMADDVVIIIINHIGAIVKRYNGKIHYQINETWKINEFMTWPHATKPVKLVCQLHKNSICPLGCFNSPQKAALVLSSSLSSFPSHVPCVAWLWSCCCYHSCDPVIMIMLMARILMAKAPTHWMPTRWLLLHLMHGNKNCSQYHHQLYEASSSLS